jgi:hypothetical protein
LRDLFINDVRNEFVGDVEKDCSDELESFDDPLALVFCLEEEFIVYSSLSESVVLKKEI